MNILIDCTNLKVGGGIQVATSVVNDLNRLELLHQFVVVLSHQMKDSFDRTKFQKNIHFIDLDDHCTNKKRISKFLLNIESAYKIDRVFCVFGPSYYKSKVPKLVGYAIPHYIYKDSPYFDEIGWVGRLKSFFYSIVKVNLFRRNSDALIFETEDARDRFMTTHNFRKKSYVVGNSLNEVFADKSQWLDLNLSINAGLKILCLSANYPHKNLKIIPEIIEEMLANNEFDFKFVISLEKADLKFDSKYDQFTGTPRYIGVNVVFDDFKLIKLGNRVVVSDHAQFLTHDYSITTAQIAVGKIPKSDIALVRGISVGNNVFIGKKAIIMPNTTIGNDVIIGAGSVVRGEIPDNSIVIGNPCTVVGKVTDQAIKWEKLLQSENARYD